MAIYVGLRTTTGDSFSTYWSSRREANNNASKITIGPDKSPGWLLSVGVYAGGRGGTVPARICLWDDDIEQGALRLWQSTQQSWGNSLAWRTASLSPALRLANDKSYWVGYWTDNTNYGNQLRANKNQSGNPGNLGWKESAGGPAANYVNYQPLDPPASLCTYIFYEPNDEPGIGSWTGYSTSGVNQVNTSQPTFSGTTPHPNDYQYDYTDAVHLQIWRPDTGQVLYEDTSATTTAERSSKTFSKMSSLLPTGIELRARFRHRDSWGVWSVWSTTIRFVCARGPLAPTITTPGERLNAISGFTYGGIYTHDINLAATGIQLRLLNDTGTQVLYDTGMVAKSVSHGAAWTHPEWHPDLKWGTKYNIEVRFRSRNEANTADVFGPYRRVAFKTNAAPNKPYELTPSSNRNTGERELSAVVNDPDGDTVSAVRIELYDITGGAMVGGYPKVVSTISGGRLTHNAGPDMITDRTYRWRAQASDGFVYGDYSDWATFTYRAAPVVSYTHPSPSGVRNRVGDPSAEYDNTTYWTEQNRIEAGINLLSPNQASIETDLNGIAAYSSTGTVPTLSRVTTDFFDGVASARVQTAGGTNSGISTTVGVTHPLRPSETTLQAMAHVKAPAGQTISVRAIAYDANGTIISFGPEGTQVASGNWDEIVSQPHPVAAEHKAGINVSIAGSTSGQVFFVDGLMVAQAPLEGEEFGWAPGTYGSLGYINVVVEGEEAYGDAAAGLRSWRAVEGPWNENYYEGQFEQVDAALPSLYYAYFKKEKGSALTIFRVDCYNNSNTFLGSVTPNSMGAAANTDVNTYWTPYGGVIWPAGHTNSVRFPTGTTKTKIIIFPSRMSEATVLFDAVAQYEVPLFSEPDWADAQRWYGYSDGDGEEYGNVPGDLAYSWTGTPGNSDSFGPPIARLGNLSVRISYFHPTSKTKDADRMVIYRAVRGEYEQVHDTGFILGNRTTIPIPNDPIKSESRYRIVISVRDSQGIITEMPSLLFDVRYEGPQELNIYVARAQPETAEVYLGFQQTTLGVNQFGGIEVAVGDERKIVALITNPATTQYVYPFPLSGEYGEYWVRQIENRGTDQIESRWDHRTVYMEYTNWWLKDVEDPYGVALPIKVYSSDEPDMDHTAPMNKYTPWGTRDPVHIVGRSRETSGSLTVRLMADDPDLTEKMEVIEQIKERRKVMCLLSQRPPTRYFVMITGITHKPAHVPYYAVYELSYEVSRYAEDYYERAGIFQS